MLERELAHLRTKASWVTNQDHCYRQAQPLSNSSSGSYRYCCCRRACMKALVDLHTMEWRESPTMKPWQPS